MSRLQRNITLAAVILPFLAFAAGIVLLWNDLVSATDLAIFAAMFSLSSFVVGPAITGGDDALFLSAVDQKAGVVQLPIERAMELTAKDLASKQQVRQIRDLPPAKF